MRKKSLFLLILIAVFGPFQAPAQARGLAVLELFTSQGCPACPPADALLKRIDDRFADVLVLGCHVTYFDRARSKDPLSQTFCNARQSAYRDAGVATKIYTPQAVINGRHVAVGSHAQDVIAALQDGGPLPAINLARNGDFLDITLPQMNVQKPVDIWLVSYDALYRGHNNGETTDYTHPVTNITKLLSWKGQPANMAFPVSGSGHFAVIAQYADYTDIIAAGKTD